MIHCDRCKVDLSFLIAHSTCVMTTGYYEVAAGQWNQFANLGESHLCDYCMWADPRYIAVYGDWRKRG